MDIIKDFKQLRGWFSYQLSYSDGSEGGVEQYGFKDFWQFRYHTSETFLKRLKEEYDYEDITLVEVHIQSEDNNFHVHMADGVFQGCCHNEVDSDLIDKNYIRQMDTIKNKVKRANDILESII